MSGKLSQGDNFSFYNNSVNSWIISPSPTSMVLEIPR